MADIEATAAPNAATSEVLSEDVLALLADLQTEFGSRRTELLRARALRLEDFRGGSRPSFLSETAEVRSGEWTVSPAPADLQDRRVEITGPTTTKMMINALNSGAKIFMADLEDANTPSWENMLEGQVNVTKAYERTLTLDSPEGKSYRLNDNTATMIIRPRGLHLDESNVTVGGSPIAASLFDIGVYAARNGKLSLDVGSGPYLYIPKLESHLEARWFNDVLRACEDRLGLDRGTIRVTVLIETILGALEMEEILYEFKERITGLNAGRWDYIFSVIKKFGHDSSAILPDRAQVTMTVPFMFAYTELMVKTCHRRGAHAIGGMSAFIPNRRKEDVTKAAMERVREDKTREAGQGCDGSWVAHPDLVALAQGCFDDVLGTRPNQLERQRDDVDVSDADITTFEVPDGSVSEAGVRGNASVALHYIDSWLRGTGAAAIYDLMEDMATAEISRSQLWQWRHHGITVDGLGALDAEVLERVIAEELEKAKEMGGARLDDAAQILRKIVLSEEFVGFLPDVAQGYLSPD